MPRLQLDNRTSTPVSSHFPNDAFRNDAALLVFCLLLQLTHSSNLVIKTIQMEKAKKYNESIAHIQLILDNTPKFPDQTYWFVLAKNYEAINLPEKALEIYQKHIWDIRGEEAKFNYATLLFQLGKNDEGAEVANTIVKDVSKGTPMYKAEQALWMEEAKKLLDKMGKSHTLKLNDDRS